MTDSAYVMLQEWLKNGTDAQKHHAAGRLALPDAVDYRPKEPEYPSLIQQAKNAIQAVGSAVSSVIHNESVSVSQEEQDRRLDICHSCEFWDAKQERCSKCGCFGQWKTWLASQKCPVGKW